MNKCSMRITILTETAESFFLPVCNYCNLLRPFIGCYHVSILPRKPIKKNKNMKKKIKLKKKNNNKKRIKKKE